MSPNSTANDRVHRGFRFGRFLLDTDRAALFVDGSTVKLRPQSFDVLRYLLERHGRLVEKQELIQAIWGDAAVTEDSLTHCIIDIRKAIGDTDRNKLRTVPRRGFVFDLPVERLSPKPGQKGSGFFPTPIAVRLTLASLVAVALWFAFGKSELSSNSDSMIANDTARSHYAQAEFLFDRRAPGDLTLARDYFFQAIEFEPDFAKAWAGLAGTYTIEWFTADAVDPETLALLKAAAERATELDPLLAEGWVRLGAYYEAIGDYHQSKQSLDRALQVQPNDPLVLSRLAGIHAFQGDLDRAIGLQRAAVSQEPLSFTNRGNLSIFLFAAGLYEEAILENTRAHQIRPITVEQPDPLQGLVMIMTQRYGDALQLIDTWPESPEKHSANAMANLKLGNQQAADTSLARLNLFTSPDAHLRRAELFAFCEELDRSFAALSALDDTLSPNTDTRLRELLAMHDLFISPFLAPLRADQRWDDWLRGVQAVALR